MEGDWRFERVGLALASITDYTPAESIALQSENVTRRTASESE
jgi:hypothetical protein